MATRGRGLGRHARRRARRKLADAAGVDGDGDRTRPVEPEVGRAAGRAALRGAPPAGERDPGGGGGRWRRRAWPVVLGRLVYASSRKASYVLQWTEDERVANELDEAEEVNN